MSKGDETRQAILDKAITLASETGLEGLSIGMLAAAVGMSKSGLFAHFNSKENLQVGVLDATAEKFIDATVVPAIKEARGEPRVRALFERWFGWVDCHLLPGGCVFVSAATELDDKPGPVRAALVQHQKDWRATLATAVRIAVEEGHFRADLDVDLFVFEMIGIFLAFHHQHRLLEDPQARHRARQAFESLLARSH